MKQSRYLEQDNLRRYEVTRDDIPGGAGRPKNDHGARKRSWSGNKD
jgi:hypothetical protein